MISDIEHDNSEKRESMILATEEAESLPEAVKETAKKARWHMNYNPVIVFPIKIIVNGLAWFYTLHLLSQ